MKAKTEITIDSGDLIRDIMEFCSKEEIIKFVQDIDDQMRDPVFTMQLRDYFVAVVAAHEPQIDWSEAPHWANWWAIGEFKSEWYQDEPFRLIDYAAGIWSSHGRTESAPSFNYTGDWEQSLRQRPTRKEMV